MEALKIVLLVVVAGIVYGIAHDLVTAHLCVEYFTIGHPRVIASESPVALALTWGVLATWWFGLAAGILLAWAARQGSRPKRAARELVRPVGICLLVMATGATLGGILGRVAAGQGWVFLVGRVAERVPEDRHVAFLTNLWAHLAAYGVGLVAVLVLVVRTRRGRKHDAGSPA